jgi:hypothetical protein
MRPYIPALGFLREIIHPGIKRARSERIKTSASFTSVYRVHLTYDGMQTEGSTILVKHIRVAGQKEPPEAEREVRFYRDLGPRLGIPLPQVYYAGPEPGGEGHLLVMEDLGTAYRFHPPSYVWTQEELYKLLQAYARLHVEGVGVLPRLEERGWLMTYLQSIEPADKLLGMPTELARRGCWPPLPGLERLVKEALEAYTGWDQHRVTVIIRCLPPNVGIRSIIRERRCWWIGRWLVGLLNSIWHLFIQPFRSARRLARQEALAFYWQQRRILEGTIPAPAERELLQRQAEILLSLALTPVAYQAALNPYPPGSAPAAYWQAMHPVLAEELQRLVGS